MTPSPLKTAFTNTHIQLLIVFLLLLVQGLYAQGNYVPGYVILENNDTLYGKIKDRNNFSGEIFQKIKFKQKGQRRKKYTARDILGYNNGVHNFKSLWYHEESEFLRSTYSADPRFGEKVFLIVYSEGPLSVYGKEFMDDSSYGDSFPLFKRAKDNYYVRATQGIFGLKKKNLARYFSYCPSLVLKIQERELKRTFEVADYYNSNCAK